MGNELESSVGYIIGTTRRVILKMMNDALLRHNIPLTIEQFVFLNILKNQPGDVTQQDMACLTCKDKSAVLRTIDILEKKGLVKRESTTGDRRKNILKLTNCEGLLDEILKIENETMNFLTQGINKEDCDAMVRALNQIQNNAAKPFPTKL